MGLVAFKGLISVNTISNLHYLFESVELLDEAESLSQKARMRPGRNTLSVNVGSLAGDQKGERLGTHIEQRGQRLCICLKSRYRIPALGEKQWGFPGFHHY